MSLSVVLCCILLLASSTTFCYGLTPQYTQNPTLPGDIAVTATVADANQDLVAPQVHDLVFIQNGQNISFALNASDAGGSGLAGVFLFVNLDSEIFGIDAVLLDAAHTCSRVEMFVYKTCPISTTLTPFKNFDIIHYFHHIAGNINGTYTYELAVFDVAGNTLFLDSAEIARRGWHVANWTNTQATQTTETFDIETLLLDYQQNTTQVVGNAGTVTFHANVTATGFGNGPSWQAQITFLPVSGASGFTGQTSPIQAVASAPITQNSITLTFSVDTSKISNGVWYPYVVISLPNGEYMYYNTTSTSALMNAQLVVSGCVDDTTPPVCSSLSLSPTSVDVSSSTATLTAKAECADDQGVSSTCLFFIRNDVSGFEYRVPCTDGTSASVVVPLYTAAGTWSIQGFLVSDKVFNVRRYGECSESYLFSLATTYPQGVPFADPCVSETLVDQSNGWALSWTSLTIFLIIGNFLS